MLALTFDVATSVVAADLTPRLPGVPVRWTVPNPAPDEFIVVVRAGSTDAPAWADRAAMDLHCWSGPAGGAPKPAHELAARLKQQLLGMAGRPNRVSRVQITGETFLPDPVTSRPRVIVSANVLLRPH